jgi:hypothetical protein
MCRGVNKSSAMKRKDEILRLRLRMTAGRFFARHSCSVILSNAKDLISLAFKVPD